MQIEGKVEIMEKPTCLYCQTNNRIQKAGFNRGGSQRLKCESCHRYFTPIRKPQGHDPLLKVQALKLYLEGMSYRGIGRQLGVQHQSVANWVSAYHDDQLPQQVEDQASTDTIEVDELFTFVGKKRGKLT